MKKRIVIISLVVLSVIIIVCIYICLNKDVEGFDSYLDTDKPNQQIAQQYNPDDASLMLRKTNAVLPELAPELQDLGINVFVVEEKDISYTIDTTTVTVIYPMDGYTQYLFIRFTDDDKISDYLFYTDLEAD